MRFNGFSQNRFFIDGQFHQFVTLVEDKPKEILPFNYEWFGESILQVNNSIAGDPNLPFMVYLSPHTNIDQVSKFDNELFNKEKELQAYLENIARMHSIDGKLAIENGETILSYCLGKIHAKYILFASNLT